MIIKKASVLFGLVCVFFLTAACTLAPGNQGGGGGGGGGGSSSSSSSLPAGAAAITIDNIKDPCLTNRAVLDIRGTASNQSGTIKGIELLINETNIVKVSIPSGLSVCAWRSNNVNISAGRTNTIKARVITGDNKTNTTSAVRVIADTEEPVLEGFLPSDNEKVAMSFSVSGKWTDPLSGIAETKIFVMRTDLLTPAVYLAPSDFYTNITAADKASYFIWTEAKDFAGNLSVSKTNTVHVEDLPVVFIDSPAVEGMTAITNMNTAAIAGRYESAWYQIKEIKVLVNGITNNAVFDTKNWNCSVALAENQTNLIEVTAVNNIENESQTKFIRVIEDSVPPQLTLQGLPQYINNNNLNLNVSALDGLSGLKGIYYQLDDNPGQNVSGSSINLNGLSEGQHNITVWASDNAGNTSAEEILSVFVDTKTPQTAIIYPVPGTITNTNIMDITGSSNDSLPSSGIKSLRVLLNGVEQAVEGGWIVRNAVFNKNAENIITAEIEDNAGNISTETSLVIVDTVPPAVDFIVPAKAGTNGFKVTPVINDTYSGVKTKYYQLDSGSDTVFTGEDITLTGLSLGTHTFSIWAADNLGNQSVKKTASFEIVPSNAALKSIDIPYVSVNPGFNSNCMNYTAKVWDSMSGVTLKPAADDVKAVVRVRVNGGSWTVIPSGGSSSLLNLSMGDNTINVKVTAQDDVTEKIYSIAVFRKDMNNWTEKTVPGHKSPCNWDSVCISQDGMKIAAASGYQYIYTSSDGGATFKQQTSAGIGSWNSIAMSADGTRIAAVDMYRGCMYSSLDGGADWFKNTSAPSNSWNSIAMSADGQKIAACTTNGYIYISTNGGTSWYYSIGLYAQLMNSISMSADGMKIAVSIYNGYIYISTNGGMNWYTKTTEGKRYWYSVSVSADGSKIAAAASGDYIYVTSDYGAGWTALTSAGSRNWRSISLSRDGSRMTAGITGGNLFTSSDSGVSWTQRPDSGTHTWDSISMTPDGMKQVAVPTERSEYIHLSIDGGASWTALPGLSRSFRSVFMTQDGRNIFAADASGYIYASSDSGNTWIENTGAGYRQWYSICSSGDGREIAAVAYGSNMVISWDGGVSWTEKMNDKNRSWFSVSITPDGSKLMAVTMSTNYFYTSSDGGVNWTPLAVPSSSFSSAAMSEDRRTIVASESGNYIYTSLDGGTNWTRQTGIGRGYWGSLSMSRDGSTMVVPQRGGYIYISTNRGASWTAQTGAGSRVWYSSAVSADGNMIAAAVNNGFIYTSADRGTSWTERKSAGSRYWDSISMSSDGMEMAAVSTYDVNIFVCQ